MQEVLKRSELVASNQLGSRGLHPVGALARPHRKKDTYHEGAFRDDELGEDPLYEAFDMVAHSAHTTLCRGRELVQGAGLEDSGVGGGIVDGAYVLLSELVHQGDATDGSRASGYQT